LNLNTSTENDPAVPLDFGGDILTSGIAVHSTNLPAHLGILLSGFHSNSTSLSDLVSHNIDITGGTAQQASDEKYESSAAQSSSAQSSSATAQLIEEKYEIPGSHLHVTNYAISCIVSQPLNSNYFRLGQN